MALVKWNPWREIEAKCVRYARAVGWPQTRPEEITATGDSSHRADIPATDTAGVIKLEIPEIKRKGTPRPGTRITPDTMRFGVWNINLKICYCKEYHVYIIHPR
jgi:hypothetical protein